MKKILSLLLVVCLMIVMAPSMVFADEAVTTTAALADTLLIATSDAATATDTVVKSDDIVILATSDVHCGVADEGAIGYAGLVAYKKAMQEQYNYVALVDNGDALQGAEIGTLSKGEYITDIMNYVGYDVLTLGNHEFDYGMDHLLNVTIKNTTAPYVSCNFRTIADSKAILDPYVIKTYGDKKVAFLGISTPETLAKSSPAYFQDADGNWIYDFCNDTTGEALYKQVQTAVDAAKKDGADYIVALGHLGNDAADTPYWKSSDVIKNTTGIDVFVDGHDHRVEVSTEKDKNGTAVTVICTGTKLANIGKITIATNGKITAENIDATVASAQDEDTAKFVADIQAKTDALTKEVVAKSAVKLCTHDAEGNRLVRKQETNLGDLCADAYLAVSGADVAFVNGGGIRAEIEAGDVTYGQIINVHPYGNKLCVVEATGQQILDALELGSRSVGVGECGGFLQVAGLTYTVNPYIASNVVLDENGMFVKVDGEYRVTDVKVAGEALDLTKTYKLASHNYMLKEAGDGYTMFQNDTILQDEVMLDNQVLITYITDYLNGAVGREYAEPQGRINILTLDNYNSAKAELAEAKAALEVATAKLEVAEYDCTVKTTAAKKAVTVKWNACEADGVKYQVYKSTKATTGFKRAITTSKTTYKSSKLTSKKTYYYKVRAIKTIDGKTYYGQWSEVMQATAK